MDPTTWLQENQHKFPNGTILSTILEAYAEYYYNEKIRTKKDANQLADEISFRLLATRNHADFEWLVHKLLE